MLAIQSTEEFDRVVEAAHEALTVGFFGDFSPASRAARGAFDEYAANEKDGSVLAIDVGQVKGLHKRFGVTSVPTVLRLVEGRVEQKVVGPQSADYYARALAPTHAVYSGGDGEEKPAHRVLVYTGAHCVWCTRVKAHLRKHRIPFTEIDVSSDPSAARSLQARTGQMGVPQLDIDGHYIVGFDKARINSLLGID